MEKDYILTKNGVSKKEILEFLDKKVFQPVFRKKEEIGNIYNRVLETRNFVFAYPYCDSIIKHFYSSMGSEEGIKMKKDLEKYELPTYESVRKEFEKLFVKSI